MSEDVKQVVALHQVGRINCAQAMLSVYGKYFGLPEDLAIKVATGLGRGFGNMGKSCGAVTGAIMVLGLIYEADNPSSREDVYILVREFLNRFTARHGSIVCNELLGCDVSTEEGRSMVREKKLNSLICLKLDQSAAEIVEELLAGKLPQPPRCD
jgi:C_GCAxxG_C_C family probable redox protein